MTRALRITIATRLFMVCCLLVGLAAAAHAQYRPMPQPNAPKSSGGGGKTPINEPYHVEVSFNLWNPAPEFIVASESLGIGGTNIDVQADLNVQQKQMYEFRLVLRPGKHHKFRFHYLPMAYTGQTTLSAEIIFNGIKFPVSTAVATELRWNTYRIGYEGDFVSRDWGYIGLILEAKYTDARVELTAPVIGREFVQARAPIPAIGLAARVYPVKWVAITGEFTAFKLPKGIQGLPTGTEAQYFDWDINGTVNFTHNFGAEIGYRTLDLRYSVEQDNGQARLKGVYFGGIARF
jgi:hypothetical protein